MCSKLNFTFTSLQVISPNLSYLSLSAFANCNLGFCVALGISLSDHLGKLLALLWMLTSSFQPPASIFSVSLWFYTFLKWYDCSGFPWCSFFCIIAWRNECWHLQASWNGIQGWTRLMEVHSTFLNISVVMICHWINIFCHIIYGSSVFKIHPQVWLCLTQMLWISLFKSLPSNSLFVYIWIWWKNKNT